MAIVKLNWRKFQAEDFADMQERLQTAAEIEVEHGEYFGQVLVGDVCFDIEIDHTKHGVQVDLCPFVPHERAEQQDAYREPVKGMAYDFVAEGVITYAVAEVAEFTYEAFCQDVAKKIQALAEVPKLAEAMQSDTSFWQMHDALWRAQREE